MVLLYGFNLLIIVLGSFRISLCLIFSSTLSTKMIREFALEDMLLILMKELLMSGECLNLTSQWLKCIGKLLVMSNMELPSKNHKVIESKKWSSKIILCFLCPLLVLNNAILLLISIVLKDFLLEMMMEPQILISSSVFRIKVS